MCIDLSFDRSYFVYWSRYGCFFVLFFFSSRRRHTRCLSDWSSDVCSSDLLLGLDRIVARALADDAQVADADLDPARGLRVRLHLAGERDRGFGRELAVPLPDRKSVV